MQKIANVIQNLIDSNDILDYALSFFSRDTNYKYNSLPVIYFVGSHQFDEEKLRSKLSEAITNDEIATTPKINADDIRVCEVNNIPRDSSGKIDYHALHKVSVIDDMLISQWQTHLANLPDTKQVAVLKKSDYEKAPPYHVSDFDFSTFPDPISSPAGSINDDAKIQASDGPYNESEANLALSNGGRLNLETDHPKTLVQAFQKTVKNRPEIKIHYIAGENKYYFQTYTDLWNEALILLGGLQQQGLLPGDFIILQITKIHEHFSAFWACVLGGIIPVTVVVPANIEDAAVIDKLKHTIRLLGSANIIISDDLPYNITHMRNIDNAITLNVFSLSELKESCRIGDIHTCSSEDVIFHQLTSGSTGNSKCVQITHKGVIAHINGIAQLNNYSQDNISLNWLPLDHVAPILMFHLKDLYLGIEQVVVKTDLILSNPLMWLEYIEKYKVTHSWAPNFGFKLVNDALRKSDRQRTYNLQHVVELMNAGEQVTVDVVKDFLQLTKPFGLVDKVIQPSYGMAETCTAITYRNDFDLSNRKLFHKPEDLGRIKNQTDKFINKNTVFFDLGNPIPGVEIRIVDKKGKLLNERQIGHLHAKGDVITSGYFNNPQANAEVFYEGSWFDTGDIGFIYDGALTLTGREKETIIIQGANYYCYDIETIVENVSGVKSTFVGACGVIDQLTNTEVMAIFFCTEYDLKVTSLSATIRNIRKEVSVSAGINPTYIIPLDEVEFPKTTSGKIQRGNLKRAFESGNFSERVKFIDIQLRNENTLSRWFFKHQWSNNLGTQTTIDDVNAVVVFCNEDHLSQSIRQVLRSLKRQVIRVEKSASFEQCGQDYFKINPGVKSDYSKLMDRVNRNYRLSHVVYLWSYKELENGDLISSVTHGGFIDDIGALYLAAVLPPALTVTLFFIANHSQQVLSSDDCDPERALVPGIVKIIQQENPYIHTRHIDLDHYSSGDARYLLNEFHLKNSPHQVAYRNGQRLTLGLQKVEITATRSKDSARIKQQAFYIVTGGLGGIGRKLCRFLLQQYEARLLILGRSMERSAKSMDAYRNLINISDHIVYRQVDLCDQTAINHAINSSAELFDQPLQGVFHLAGIYQPVALADESVSSLNDATSVKVQGTKTLASLLHERNPTGLFLAFSSIFSFFGGSMVGAYAAGNRFLENFVSMLRRKTALKAFCLSWSNWDDLGMSKGYKNLQARGYEAITPKQGWRSLAAALQHGEPVVLIGLDDSRAYVSVHCNVSPRNKQKLVAFYTADSNKPRENVSEVRDLFGNHTQCQCLRVESLPLTATGDVDIEKLRFDHFSTSTSENKITPRTPCEKTLRKMWRDILKKEAIGIDDNFFEVGGNSLKMIMLIGEMSREFYREFTVAEFFKFPNIAKMASYIDHSLEDNKAANARKKRLQKRIELHHHRYVH